MKSPTKQLLHQKYVVEQKTLYQVAQELKISYSTLRRYFKKYRVPVRTMLQTKRLKQNFGRTIGPHGYMKIRIPNHPFADNGGYVKEHRAVIEKAIGRYLKSKEIVHHINGIKLDNRIENLILFPNRKAHIQFRHYGNKTFICKFCHRNQKENYE